MNSRYWISFSIYISLLLATMGLWFYGAYHLFITEKLLQAQVWIGLSILVSLIRFTYQKTIYEPTLKESLIENLQD